MLVVPEEVRVRYAEFLTRRGVAKRYGNKCQKWLRFYIQLKFKRHVLSAKTAGQFFCSIYPVIRESSRTITTQTSAY